MYEEIQVFTHSSIRISRGLTIYFDPFRIEQETHDADIIFITHDHFDHYSPEDIAKIKNPSTVLVCPKSISASLSDSGIDEEFTELVEPFDELEINDIKIEVIPAYNIGKNFHPRTNNWVGYVVDMENTRYYIAGDTDINEDVKKVNCNIALLPVGGTYTMNAEEAANLAVCLNPAVAIPTHYGSVAGDPADGLKFVDFLDGKIPAILKIK